MITTASPRDGHDIFTSNLGFQKENPSDCDCTTTRLVFSIWCKISVALELD